MKPRQNETAPQTATALPVTEPTGGEGRWRRVPEREPVRETGRGEVELPLEGRVRVEFPVSFATIDAQRDRATGALFYETGEALCVRDASRRGIGLRTAGALAPGTRLLLHVGLGAGPEPVALIARAVWSRAEYVRGERAARPVCALGLELLGGARDALDRYERALAALVHATSVAGGEALG